MAVLIAYPTCDARRLMTYCIEPVLGYLLCFGLDDAFVLCSYWNLKVIRIQNDFAFLLCNMALILLVSSRWSVHYSMTPGWLCRNPTSRTLEISTDRFNSASYAIMDRNRCNLNMCILIVVLIDC
jgi:hypothetical protein